MEPDAAELRVLGCLVEKQRTTPDQYPLTLNALRAACNQSTNRDPVVDLDEHTVREAAQRLGKRRWARLASGQGSRAPKYRHLLDEALVVGDDELAVLAVLLLRGPQTPGELKGRTERMHRFASLEEVDHALDKLIAKGHATRIGRRPGQKEDRFAQTLGDAGGLDAPPVAAGASEDAAPVAVVPPVASTQSPSSPADDDVRAELRALREEVAALRGEVADLKAELGA